MLLQSIQQKLTQLLVEVNGCTTKRKESLRFTIFVGGEAIQPVRPLKLGSKPLPLSVIYGLQ